MHSRLGLRSKFDSWFLSLLIFSVSCFAQETEKKARVIVTSDGEIDDECSMVRFFLYANEFDASFTVPNTIENEATLHIVVKLKMMEYHK